MSLACDMFDPTWPTLIYSVPLACSFYALLKLYNLFNWSGLITQLTGSHER